jgi:hypothetical protein
MTVQKIGKSSLIDQIDQRLGFRTPQWDKPTPNWDQVGYPREGVGGVSWLAEEQFRIAKIAEIAKDCKLMPPPRRMQETFLDNLASNRWLLASSQSL